MGTEFYNDFCLCVCGCVCARAHVLDEWFRIFLCVKKIFDFVYLLTIIINIILASFKYFTTMDNEVRSHFYYLNVCKQAGYNFACKCRVKNKYDIYVENKI